MFWSGDDVVVDSDADYIGYICSFFDVIRGYNLL
jgi:hypothetical protein